jgi:hypothetical protein
VSPFFRFSHTEFEERSTFWDQIAYILERISLHPENTVAYRDLAGVFSCSVSSIDFQIKCSSEFVRPNGQPQLLTPEGYQMVSQLASNTFKRHGPISMVYTIERIQPFFEIAVSLNRMSHIVKQMPGLKTVKGIPIE